MCSMTQLMDLRGRRTPGRVVAALAVAAGDPQDREAPRLRVAAMSAPAAKRPCCGAPAPRSAPPPRRVRAGGQARRKATRPGVDDLAARDGVMSELWGELRSLPLDYRRVVLQRCFSQIQRLTLEHWMLRRRRVAQAAIRLGGQRPQPPLMAAAWGHGRALLAAPPLARMPLVAAAGSLGGVLPPGRGCREVARGEGRGVAKRQAPCGDAAPPRRRGARPAGELRKSAARFRRGASAPAPRGLIAVASARTGALSFYALAYVGMLRMVSRHCADAGTALQCLEALLAIRRRVLADPAAQATARAGAPAAEAAEAVAFAAERRLPGALREVLLERGLDGAALGLKLSVRINIKRWVSMSLASPTYRTDAENAAGAAPGDVAPQLARALRALVRLARARLRLAAAERRGAAAAPPSAEEQSAWGRFRETFLDIEAESGLDRSARAARVAAAERAKAAHRDRLAEQWNRKHMAVEDRAQLSAAATSPPTAGGSLQEAFATRRIVKLLGSLGRADRQRCRRAARISADSTRR